MDTNAIDSAPSHAEPERVRARQAAERFIERMGILSQADGMPRIAGRLIGLMVLEGGPLAFGDLARRLKVSRASISTNARLLESMGFLERVTRPGERGDYFQLATDPYIRLLEGIAERRERARHLLAETRHVLAETAAGPPGALVRLDEMTHFHDILARSFERLKAELSAPATGRR